MEKLKLKPNNKKYYSDEFIKGFECGVERQFNADMSENTTKQTITYAIDYVDDFIKHEKIFMEVVSDIRTHNMFTFPVLTYSLLKRDDISEEEKVEMIKTKNWNVFKDNDFARWCSDHNVDWNDSNFFMSDNVGTLSNCCRLLSDTKKLNAFINSLSQA